VESRDEVPVGGLGDFPQKLKQFTDIVLQIDLKIDQNLEIWHNSAPHCRPVRFTGNRGLSDIGGGLSLYGP